MGVAVGVDLGTSNSMIACYGGPGQRFPSSEVPDAVPSVVAYLDGGAVVVGSRARRRGASDPAATIGSAKRFLGRGYPAVAGTVGSVAYDVVPVTEAVGPVRRPRRAHRAGGSVGAACCVRSLTSSHVGSARRSPRPCSRCPPSSATRSGGPLREAAGLAGVDVMRIMNEPAAAALAYGFDREGQETVMVFDLGGGTLDVGVVDVGFGIVEVRAVAGDGYLGGDDFDRAIADHLADEVADGTGVDPREDPRTLAPVARGGRAGQGAPLVGDQDPGQRAGRRRGPVRARRSHVLPGRPRAPDRRPGRTLPAYDRASARGRRCHPRRPGRCDHRRPGVADAGRARDARVRSRGDGPRRRRSTGAGSSPAAPPSRRRRSAARSATRSCGT